MRISLLWAVLCLTAATAFSQDLAYVLEMPEPHTHYFEVTMDLKNQSKKSVDLKMATWTPGSYLIREFSRNVEGFKAEASGKPLEFEKVSKNTWRVFTNGNRSFQVRYRVYAFERSVRTSFIDADHGFVDGASIFLYPADGLNLESTLSITPPPQWEIVTTAMEPIPGKRFHYRSPDFATLVDTPIEIGNHNVIQFEAAGTHHTVALFGEGNYQEEKLVNDMSRIIEKVTSVFGSNPNKEYTFIIHNQDKTTGGLEHANSTTLQVNRWIYQPHSKYLRFLSLVAHEYFHVWNVKRLKPSSFIPYDYENENYTRLLWLMEGITDYYDLLLVKAAGLMSENAFRSKLESVINRVENTPGKEVQSLAEASFDSWIKAYRRDENSVNSSISYYSKGSLVGWLLDLAILSHSGGAQSLDDLMKHLYKQYSTSGLTDEAFEEALSDFLGPNASQYLEQWVYGYDSLPYNSYLNKIGLELIDQSDSSWLEMGWGFKAGEALKVSSVLRGSTAYEGGTNVNDEILAIDGYRVFRSNLWTVLDRKQVGDSIRVDLSRDGKMMSLELKILPNYKHEYSLVYLGDLNREQRDLSRRWLRAAQP